ncbi:unnamed protein product [Linum trigynum]|uniref:BED-type domain-containing protein n=1 Tax=Linum trigynum TaxID=586398 RepID=A0AAV2EU63_9ROSI
MEPRAPCWKQFSKFNDKDGNKKSRCDICGIEYDADPQKNGTNAMNAHMRRGCRSIKGTTQQLLNLEKTGIENEGALTNWKFDQEAIRKGLAYMITVDELPFKFVEGMGFKYFMSLCCPRFNIPSRRTMTRDCFGFYGEMKDKLKKFFQSCEGSVCLTTDAWTSNKQDSFMCLTAHFIDQDWKLRKKIINFGELKGHKGVDSHYTTSNLFLQEVHSLYHLINKWVEEVEKDYDLSVMAKKMKLKYEKYWGDVDKMNKLLYIATVMDPRYKLGFLEYGLKRVYPEDGKGGRMAEDVRKATFELFAHYEQVWKSKQHKGASTATLTPIVEECGNDVIDVLAEYKRHREQIDGVVNKSELERYLREADEPMEMNFDVLGWWKVNCSRFPALSMMAKDVLAVPISTVASESAFSAGGRILDDFRSSLTPRIVEALICSSDWIRGDSRPSLDEEDAEEVDKIDEELNKLMDAISIRDNLVSSTSTSNVTSGRTDGDGSSSGFCDSSDFMHD